MRSLPVQYEGSSSSIGTGSEAGWVATREYRARFPEDLGLSAGDLVTILDTSDPDWFHG